MAPTQDALYAEIDLALSWSERDLPERERIEIVVVDKGSQDESPTLDTEFSSVTFLRLPRNFGTTKALNIGMRTGVGELVLFLSPLIEVSPETISTLTARLEEDTNSIAVCPLIIDQAGNPVEQARRLPMPLSDLGIRPPAQRP